MRKIALILICTIISSSCLAAGNAKLRIKGGNDNEIPIAVKKVTGTDLASFNIAYKIKKRIIEQLEDTHIFKLEDTRIKQREERLSLMKTIAAKLKQEMPTYSELTVILESESRGRLTARITLYDLFSEKNVIEETISFPKKDWHRGAAQISDLIYKHYTGLVGYINTRLVFISEHGSLFSRKKKIAVMDLYGNNVKYITNGKNLVLTPRLSPDAKKIIYLSYTSGFPTLYLLDLEKMKSKKLFEFEGMMYAPRFSQDGKKIVLAASYEGNSEIAIYDIKKKKLTRLTHHYAIDTSPDFSPDGSQVIFSSDRAGGQQLYLINSDGSNLQRIDLGRGSYATPNWSPDGKYIAFTKMYKGKFHIGVINMINYDIKILTTSYKDESPTWAPNSKFIIFSRKKDSDKNLRRGSNELFMVNLNGVLIKKIDTPNDASDPDWVRIEEDIVNEEE